MNNGRKGFNIIVIFLVCTFAECIFVTTNVATSVISQRDLPLLNAIGYASYYSYECADQPMANGNIFDPEKRTCASWFYGFGTALLVESLDTGRSTEVVVTDRGPNRRLVKKGRIIDLSMRAFKDICNLEKGLTRVRVYVRSYPKSRR